MLDLKDVFSEAMIHEAKNDDRIVVLDADVGRSTKMLDFKDAYPQRFFQFGVAEQNMIATAAGMAREGLIPFAVAFSPFITLRPIEMFRNCICYPRRNVKIIAEYAGFTDGKDGATHTSMEDLGIVRCIPGTVILSPSDPVSLRKMIKSIIDYPESVYVRIETEKTLVLYPDDFVFTIGKTYKPRIGGDVTIAAYGSAVRRAAEAADELKTEGINAEVLDCITLKPFDENTLLESVTKTNRIVSVEDHNIFGGLATIISEVLAKNGIAVKFRPLAVKEVFTESGTPERLRKKYGTDKDDIINEVKTLMESD